MITIQKVSEDEVSIFGDIDDMQKVLQRIGVDICLEEMQIDETIEFESIANDT